MPADIKEYSFIDGIVKSTKGETIWLTCNEKEVPITTIGDIIEHILPGHKLKILRKSNGEVSRIYNQTTDLIYHQHDSETSPMAANAMAIRFSIICGIPLIGAGIGLFFVAPSIIISAISQGGPARNKVVAITFMTMTAYVAVGIGCVAMKFWLGAIAGPAVVTFFGLKKIFSIEAELSQRLDRLVKEKTIE
jgi:hypothetical protein